MAGAGVSSAHSDTVWISANTWKRPCRDSATGNSLWNWGDSHPQLMQMAGAPPSDLSALGTVSCALTWSFPRISKSWWTTWLAIDYRRKILDSITPLPSHSLFWCVCIFSGEGVSCQQAQLAAGWSLLSAALTANQLKIMACTEQGEGSEWRTALPGKLA